MDYDKEFEEDREKGKIERITAQRFVFKEGDTLTGLYLGRDLIKAVKKGMTDSYSYRFDTKDGPVTCFISSAYDKQHGAHMEPGCIYRIAYKNKIQISEGRTLKIFDVWKGRQMAPTETTAIETEDE